MVRDCITGCDFVRLLCFSTEMLKYVNVAMPPPTPGDDRPRFSLYLSSILLCGTIQIHILQSDVFQSKQSFFFIF